MLVESGARGAGHNLSIQKAQQTMTETEDRKQTQVQTQTAEISISAGSFSAHVKVQATPAGLIAVGGLVGCILLSVTALVWVATTPMRRHPFATAALRR